VFTVPDQFSVPENLFNSVQRNTVKFTPGVYQIEGKMVTGLEENFAQGHTNDFARYPVMVADLEVTLAEGIVPVNAIKQFVYGYHGKFPPPRPCRATPGRISGCTCFW
jgi:hypothetical protein